MKILITCMDRRLNSYLDERNDGSITILRNAGANVMGLTESITNLLNDQNVDSIEVLTHTDCGAMKVVFGVLHNEENASDAVLANLVAQFSKRGFANNGELEILNEKIQGDGAKKIADVRGIKHISELLDISRLNTSGGGHDHKLFIMKPTSKKYSELIGSEELGSAYIIEAMNIDEVMSDIEIAVKNLGISNIVFVANGSSEYRQVTTDASRLGMKPFMNGVKSSVMKL